MFVRIDSHLCIPGTGLEYSKIETGDHGRYSHVEFSICKTVIEFPGQRVLFGADLSEELTSIQSIDVNPWSRALDNAPVAGAPFR